MKYRKSVRIKDYDYKTDGYYFITICTTLRESLLEKYRSEIELLLQEIPERFQGVKIDFYSIMPDHIHIIFILNNSNTTLGGIVRTFKALVTKTTGCKPFWEWSYYEHVIRNKKALEYIRKYLYENPLKDKIEWNKIYSGINATATK